MRGTLSIGALSLDPAVRLALRASLAVLLLSAAAHKLRDAAGFRAALAGYRLLPAPWVAGAAVLFVGLELAVAASLVLANGARGPALAAAVLLGVYTAAIAANLLRGRRGIDCGCAGPAGRVPLGGGLVGRNAVLIGAALAAAVPAAPRAVVWLDAVTIAAASAALLLLYTAADTALANGARAGRLTARHRSDRLPHPAIGGSQ
jgi:hypothetical protein